MGVLKQIAIASLALGGLVALPASAQTLPAATVQTFSSNYIYHQDFDVLVLDFTLQTAGTDALETLTIVKNGTAREQIDYMNLKLWADEGPLGFQGWGIDKSVGVVSYQDSVWVIDNIDYAFESSHRFFASIESGVFLDEKIAQFALQPSTDDGDGQWETGERGIYFQSGATAYVADGAYSTTLRFKSEKPNTLGPKGYIASLPASATVEPHNILSAEPPIVFIGEAKDRNGGSVQSVWLMINGVDVAATNTGTNFSTWNAEYTPAKSYEELTIVLKASDGTYTWESVPYHVTLDQRLASFDATTIAVSKSAILADGKDSTTISVILNDEQFTPLPNRQITIRTLRSGDHLAQTEITTDEFGRATVSLTSTQPGNAIIQVYEGDEIVGGVAVFVQEVVEPEPTTPQEPQPNGLQEGDLIKGSLNAVYYYDGSKRHVFVTETIYRSWYGTDFSRVKTVSDTELATIALGAPVGFRPGTLIKTPSIPNVYVVDLNQTLRHVTSEQVAGQIFGAQWNKQIYDLSEALLFTYAFGNDIITELEYNQQEVLNLPLTISDEL